MWEWSTLGPAVPLISDVKVHLACIGHEVLVAENARVIGDFAFAVVHHNDSTHGLEGWHQLPHGCNKRAVNKDNLVLGMVHDIGELLGEQADVQGVQYAPGGRDAIPQVEVVATAGVSHSRTKGVTCIIIIIFFFGGGKKR